MSNTRHIRGGSGSVSTRRAALGLPDPPPAFGGPEPLPQSLPDLIGEAAALHLAGVLPKVLARELYRLPSARLECYWCVAGARQAVRAYEVACEIATKAGEPVPDAPEPPQVAQSVTLVPAEGGPLPACWEHVPLTAAGA